MKGKEPTTVFDEPYGLMEMNWYPQLRRCFLA